VVLHVKHVLLGHVRLGKHGVALAEVALAAAEVVLADGVAVLVAVAVLDELANASVAVFHACALEAVFVRLANSVECVNWWTVTWVGHWAVAFD